MWSAEGSFFSQGGSDGGQETKKSSHPRQVSAILLATRYMASPLRPQALLHSPRLLALCQSQCCGPSLLPALPVSGSARCRAGGSEQGQPSPAAARPAPPKAAAWNRRGSGQVLPALDFLSWGQVSFAPSVGVPGRVTCLLGLNTGELMWKVGLSDLEPSAPLGPDC